MTKGKIILKRNKLINKIWHPESTLVFKSSTEKLVIGRLDGSDIIPLDDEAIDLCVQWKFKYDTSLVEEEVSASDEGDDDEDDQDEENEVKKVQVNEEVEDEEVEEEDEEVEDHEKVNDIIQTPTKQVHGLVTLSTSSTSSTSYTSSTSSTSPTSPTSSTSNVDVQHQLDVVLTMLKTSTDTVSKNFKKILADVQQKAVEDHTSLSKELSDTKEHLGTTTKEYEDTKAKLAKIRSALGF